MGNEEDSGEIRREGRKSEGKREKDIHTRCNRRIYCRTRTAVRAPLSAGILAVNQICDLRSARVYINSATSPIIRSVSSAGGRCLASWTVASGTLHSHQRKMSSSRGCFLPACLLFPNVTRRRWQLFLPPLCGFPRDFEG